MQQRALCAQNMATPYVLWPYMPISPLTSSPDIPVFQGQFPQNGLSPNDLHTPFFSPQLYANNIVLQTYRRQQQQQQQQQQQRVPAENGINSCRDQEQFIYPKTDLNANMSNTGPNGFDSPPPPPRRCRRVPTPSRIRSSPNSVKKGLFTIDAILNKDNDNAEEKSRQKNVDDDDDDDDDDDNKLSTPPSSPPLLSPLPKQQLAAFGGSPSMENWFAAHATELPAVKILNETPTRDSNCVVPMLHSTPVNFHSPGAVSPRRHNGPYIEASHPYLPKHMDVYQSHLLSSYQHQHHHHHHHQNLFAQQQNMSPQSSTTSRSSFGSSSLPSSVSMSTSSSPASSSSSSAASLSSPQIDKADRKTSNKNKRIRTIFTPEQLERLEAEFERQQYMVGTERFYLASSLHLTEAQVKVWFQNRRIKWRKQHLEQQQARLAQGDLYRDVEESGESDLEEDVNESMTSVSAQDHAMTNDSSDRGDVD